jgi:putative copper export protein
MDWAVVIVQWLHMFFGIFWFGGALFGTFVLGPHLISMPPDRMREFLRPFARHADRIILPVALIAIGLGIVRGTVFGPVRSVEALLGTAYGLTWLTALVAAVFTFYWGARNARGAQRDLEAGVDVTKATGKALRNVGIEMLGFAVILSAMVLMRFGA